MDIGETQSVIGVGTKKATADAVAVSRSAVFRRLKIIQGMTVVKIKKARVANIKLPICRIIAFLASFNCVKIISSRVMSVNF